MKFVLGRTNQASLKLIIGNYGSSNSADFDGNCLHHDTTANWPDPSESQFHLCTRPLQLAQQHPAVRRPQPRSKLFEPTAIRRPNWMPTWWRGRESTTRFRRIGSCSNCETTHSTVVRFQCKPRFKLTLKGAHSICVSIGTSCSVDSEIGKSDTDLVTGPEHIAIDTPIEETMAAVTRLALRGCRAGQAQVREVDRANPGDPWSPTWGCQPSNHGL